jgi:hypothetical protein
VQLRRRRYLVPLLTGLVIGALFGLQAKDAATDPANVDGMELFYQVAGLFILLIGVGIVGAVLVIPERTRSVGIGIVIGVLAWAVGFVGGDLVGPRHQAGIVAMGFVSTDRPDEISGRIDSQPRTRST